VVKALMQIKSLASALDLRWAISLGAGFGMFVPSALQAMPAYRTMVVVPSVYRQAFSKSQSSWGRDALLQQGMRLGPEDRLISKGSGIATIICNHGAYIFKKKNYTQVSSFCQAQRVAPVLALPGSQDASIPYLLEPRTTLVRGPGVMVRWNPVAGVRRYQIWLLRQRDRRLLWGTQVQDDAYAIVPAQLGLVPGEWYQLVIEAENGTSSQLEPANALLRFGLISTSEAYQLELDRSGIRALRTQPISTQSLVLLEAAALEQRGLVAEAIALLERQERQDRSLEGQLQLGRLTSLQGLNQQAQVHFHQAALLAQAAGDHEASLQAQAAAKLASRLAVGSFSSLP
jgi:hypothetical protein